MSNNLKDAIKRRRTYYGISDQSPVPDEEIEELIHFAATHVPSAFNSQSSRLVLLLGDNHTKLWEIVKDALRKVVPAEQFAETASKIDGVFASGHGTVLFFEDEKVVKGLQEAVPLYKDNFPLWSEQGNAMMQFAVWTLLEDAGFGASLQHYNPLINEAVAKTWKLDKNWTLKAQMPFGKPTSEPGQKESKPLADRVKVFS